MAPRALSPGRAETARLRVALRRWTITMSLENMDILLVSDDSRLRRMVQRHSLPELSLRAVTSDEFLAAPPPPADVRLWLDQDTGILLSGDLRPAVLFYSDSPPRKPLGALLARKPLRGEVAALLWAGAASASRRAPAPLPMWIERFHELDYQTLCERIIRELPRRLGFAAGALYLLDEGGRMLTLAGTTEDGALELVVAADAGSDHPLAVALHTVEQALPDGIRIVPLRDGTRTLGVLRLSREGGERMTPADRDAVLAFVARCLDHARRFEKATFEARVDGLTGLYNCRWLRETLAREIGRARRQASPLALVMFDLDDLKRVNDRFGHLAGDAVLRHVAAKIRATLRESDSAARTGGDEFVVVLPDTTLEGAGLVADRICTALQADAPTIAGRLFSVTASHGVAAWHPGASADDLLESADAAMYANKRLRGAGEIRSGRSPA